jgi:hippurate hydrolase
MSEFEKWVAFRRDLHRHPELSFKEKRTAEQIEKALAGLGIRSRRVAGTGVVAEIPGGRGGEGPLVAIRADIDALPILEETGLEYASVNDGVMHACGHDGHTAMVLGAAEMLAKDGNLPAPVRLVFQPAEEKGLGALAMINAGALDGVGMIFGGHVDRHYPTGQIVAHAGAVNASTDSFRIQIQGKGGHAARPHEGVDAVVVGSLLVMAIQTIVSREINPAHPSVVTVGRFDAGTAPNVLPDHATLEGTIRAQEKAVRDHIVSSLGRICDSIGLLHNARLTLTLEEGTPPVVNPEPMAEIARKAAVAVVGEANAVPLHTPNMGGEDFACYMEKIPGCYVRLGARAPGREGFPAHSSKFEFDEDVLPVGARYFYEVARLAGRILAGETGNRRRERKDTKRKGAKTPRKNH